MEKRLFKDKGGTKMIIGAQSFTVRDYTKDESGISASLKKLHDIGYRAIQVSAFGPIAPERLRELADENELKIEIGRAHV